MKSRHGTRRSSMRGRQTNANIREIGTDHAGEGQTAYTRKDLQTLEEPWKVSGSHHAFLVCPTAPKGLSILQLGQRAQPGISQPQPALPSPTPSLTILSSLLSGVSTPYAHPKSPNRPDLVALQVEGSAVIHRKSPTGQGRAG